jgi:DNA-binding MarR family transcriptional regulator
LQDLQLWQILRAFHRSGGVAYGAQIATATGVARSTVSANLAALRAGGLLTTQPPHGQAHPCALTPRGQILAEAATRRLTEITTG